MNQSSIVIVASIAFLAYASRTGAQCIGPGPCAPHVEPRPCFTWAEKRIEGMRPDLAEVAATFPVRRQTFAETVARCKIPMVGIEYRDVEQVRTDMELQTREVVEEQPCYTMVCVSEPDAAAGCEKKVMHKVLM